MLKKIYLSSSLLLFYSINSFAVTDQIAYATKFLNEKENIVIQQNIFNLGKDDNNNFNNNLYLKNITNKPEYFATANNKDISLKNNKFNPLLQSYQSNNHLESTGFMTKETIDFIHEQQDIFGLNVTDYLDPNTWFISYNQPLPWKVKTIQDSLIEWNKVLEKQKIAATNKFIVVNIPNMRLTAYNWDNNTNTATEEIATRVVIGSQNHKTPMDDMLIWGIKYNPTWIPTNNIIKRTLFKGNTLNMHWLSSHKIMVFNNEGEKIDYSSINEENFKSFRYVQPSGNDNALGLLKFETNSKDNIYLHDTNEKSLFKYNSRAYSSGCIRVDDYLPVASWISQDNENQIVDRIKKGQTRILNTPSKIPVYTTYTQAYFDDEIPAFAPDPYRKNKTIIYK